MTGIRQGHAEAGPDAASNSATAQAMFDEAKSLVESHRYEEACPKFEESQRLEPAGGTLLHLAACYEHLNRFATAWSKYLEAADAAERAHRSDRQATARQRAAAVSARVGRIVIHVTPPIDPDLAIVRDGQTVGRPQWDMAIPVDPGEHTVSASIPGRVSWSTKIAVPPTAGVIELTVPTLAKAPLPEVPNATSDDANAEPLSQPNRLNGTAEPPVRAVVPRASPVVPSETSPLRGAHRFHFGAQRVIGTMLAAGGVAGLSIGAVYAAIMVSKRDEASRRCPGTTCDDPTVGGLAAGAKQARGYATIALAAGGLAVLSGTVLWLTEGDPNDSAISRRGMRVGVGPSSIVVSGTW